MGEALSDRLLQFMTLVVGGSVAILGLAVLAGWYTHDVTLIQLAPTLAPMPYNTALSFLLSGLGLVALTFGWTRLAGVCATIVAVIGSLTLIEYLCDISLGIDQLFVTAYITVRTSYPGRMGLITALCLALTGISVMVMSWSTYRERMFLITGPLGSIILAFGLVAFIDHLAGLETSSWRNLPDMPAHTALGCVALGGGIMAFAWRAGATGQAMARHRFAVLVSIGVLTVTLCLWQALIGREQAVVERTIELAKASAHNELTTQMQSRILSLIRIARRWEMQGRPLREVWEAEVGLYMSHYPGVHAVALVGPSFDVQWMVPPEGDGGAQGLDLGSEDQRQRMLEVARDSRQVTATGTLDLAHGGKGFQVYVPMIAGGQFDGFIAGMFRVQDLLDIILAHEALRYSIAIFEGEKEIYSRYSSGGKHEGKWGQETAVGLYGVTWRIRIWPTPTLLAEMRSSLPEVVLAMGLLTGVLLVWAVYLTQIAQRRATQVDLVNQALQNEIGEHKHTEALLAARFNQIEAVRAVIIEITRELDLPTLLRLITRRAMDLVDAAHLGAVYLWDETAQALIPHAWHGRGEWMQQARIRLGEGVVGTVAERREGLIVNDYQHSPYAHPLVIEHVGATAILAEPLLYRDRLVGVIVLDNRGTTQLFTHEDLELFSLFAAQAAIAIENARLYETLEERFTRLQTLAHLNQLVSSSLDTGQVLKEIAQAAATLMNAPVVSFWLADETTRTLQVQAFSDEAIGTDFPTPEVSFAEGGVGWVATHRLPLNVPHVFQDQRFIALDWWHRHNLCSFFGLPILHEESLIAVLSLNGRLPFQFGYDEESLLKSFAAQTVVALRNARQFSEIQHRTTHLAELNAELHNEISERIRAEEALQQQAGLMKLLQSVAVAANEAKSVDDAIQTVVDQVCAYTSWPVGHVYVVDEDATDVLISSTIWHLEDPQRFETFRRITEATRFTRGQGLPGRVLASAQGTWIPDVTTDPNFPRAKLAQDIGVRAGFGFPVMVGTEVVAVLEFFSDKTVEPDEALLEVMGHIGTQLGRVVERQRAEEALRASEVRFRSVVQSANDAIIIADSQGRIMTWNPGAQAIFGYTEAEVLGKSLTLLMPARYHEAHQRGMERLRAGGRSRLVGRTVEFHGLRKDGSEFPLELSMAVWQTGGSTFCSGMIRDITERQQATEQLQRQQEALYQREKLAAMGSLLASVAHELNNPLSVVMVEAELLSQEFESAELVERIKAISQSAERCVHIVRNFLALARQNPPQRTSVTLNTVVEEALALLAYTLRVDDIEVEQQLAAELPPLWADPHQLYQVVVNLLTNAHQALRESTSPRRLTLTTQYDASRQVVSLEVADTGPGIPTELQERIFEPFFTTKPPGVGTGLGLPFCKGIIEGHGGSIRVVSAAGHGTRFRIELPVEATPSAGVPAPVSRTQPPVEGKTILIIDDEPGITSALAYLLRRDKHTVETAANGRLGLAKLRERTYDLILCDLRMPELDGPGFYHELEHSYPHLLGRVVFLTGDTLSPEAREFLEKIGVARLSKPFRAAEVRQAVQQALHIQ
jgi:PAS domain S-box-containing protein